MHASQRLAPTPTLRPSTDSRPEMMHSFRPVPSTMASYSSSMAAAHAGLRLGGQVAGMWRRRQRRRGPALAATAGRRGNPDREDLNASAGAVGSAQERREGGVSKAGERWGHWSGRAAQISTYPRSPRPDPRHRSARRAGEATDGTVAGSPASCCVPEQQQACRISSGPFAAAA